MSSMMIWGRYLLGMVMSSALALGGNSAFAQITPDKTLPNNSSVTVNGSIFNITGGTTAGRNLFHSFQQFSVPTGGTALFQNAVEIENIISRVTGGSISNIDGLIKANGTANLFLINPNGIVFGPNASLNVGGSFVASTANSLKFKDGTEFSATNPQTTPLLTVSVPIGLQFGPNPGSIEVRGTGHQIDYDNNFFREDPRDKIDTTGSTGLQVQPGNTLALVGGNISVEGGILTSPAGRIEIGSFGSNQLVGIDVKPGLKLGYEGVTNFGDIQLSGKALVNTTGDGGGTIAIAGRNIKLSGESILLADTLGNQNGGEISIFGDSIVLNRSSLGSDSFSSGNTGQIKLDATKNIRFENQSTAGIQTSDTGDAGNINIHANSLSIENSNLNDITTENSFGRAGDINLNVADLAIKNTSYIVTYTFSMGDAGNINISANSFLLENSGVLSQTLPNSTGRARDININANLLLVENGIINSITSGYGIGGNVTINTDSLRLNNSAISTSTLENSAGNAGAINVNTNSLAVTNGAAIVANTLGSGNGGNITINAREAALFDGISSRDGSPSGVSSAVGSGLVARGGTVTVLPNGSVKVTIEPPQNAVFTSATGDSGNINITADQLSVTNGARLTASTFGKGSAGNININTVNARFSNTDTNGSSSGAFSAVQAGAVGNAGAINITTDKLTVNNGAQLVASTFGQGDAGRVQIKASNVIFDGVASNGTPSGVFGAVETGATGNGGNLNFAANRLMVRDGAEVSASNEGTGRPGNIQASARLIFLDNQGSLKAESLSGSGGNINLRALGLLLLKNNSLISAISNGLDYAGNIIIDSGFLIGLEKSNIIANITNPRFNLTINAQGFLFSPGSEIIVNGEKITDRLPRFQVTVAEPPVVRLANAHELVKTSCAAFDTGGSSFTVTGRGGLPPSPDEPLTNDVIWTDARIPTTTQHSSKKPSVKPHSKPKAEPIVIAPAIGWVFNKDKGEVTLISSRHNANSLGTTPATCPTQR